MLHAMITVDPEANSRKHVGLGAEFALPALRSFLRRASRAVPVDGNVSVLLTTDAEIKRLNQIFRGIRKATDVLSFPALAVPTQNPTSRPTANRRTRVPAIAGDLAISLETAARQAAQFGHPLLIELKILMLHGLVHLAGYDHESDAGEMATREEQLRRRFRLPSALIARSLKGETLPRAIEPGKILHRKKIVGKRTGRP
ncbi:MAG TPA: rRNA maturation RNase YbeY [Acidobacteriaceae bacterium]|nr:rRNA maturation RNase YbeY [Acidobacteriaceae bacterium]